MGGDDDDGDDDRISCYNKHHHHHITTGNTTKGDNNSGSFRPSEIYGAEHLLRLFVRLPHLLAQAPMTPQEATQVGK